MAYDPRVVVASLRRLLAAQPTMTLTMAARRLGLDRHTIARALRRMNATFSDERRVAICSALDALVATGRPMSSKEVANLLGCSTRSAARWSGRRSRSERPVGERGVRGGKSETREPG